MAKDCQQELESRKPLERNEVGRTMREFPFIQSEPVNDGRFQITFDLMVHSPAQLWASAAARGCGFTGMDMDEIEEVIGPREDPDIPACLSMLMAPLAVPGCQGIDFTAAPALVLAPCMASDWPQSALQGVRSVSE